MIQLIVLLAVLVTTTSLQVENENWRRFKSEVLRQKLVGIDSRAACNEPYKHGISFDCETNLSTEKPTSVHELSPGDIKVIGAIGDSITAGNGAYACNVFEVFNEYRGASWSVGGDSDFTLALTLPNILRHYNPDLIGYSLGVGKVDSNSSHLNCAVPGAISRNMSEQAMNLVERINVHPDIDINRDWKVITLFIGGNDLCDHCEDPTKYTKEDYIHEITLALDYFHDKLPRTFINVVGLLNITELVTQEMFICKAALSLLCSCIVNLDQAAQDELTQLNKDYQDILRDLANSGKYDTRDDFTVVYQPFMENTAFPVGSDGKVDKSYMAPDCFHLSAKGHAFAARDLWTNMLQPVGLKSNAWDPYPTSIPCPTKDRPYFATVKNSIGGPTDQSGLTSRGVVTRRTSSTTPSTGLGVALICPKYLSLLIAISVASFLPL